MNHDNEDEKHKYPRKLREKRMKAIANTLRSWQREKVLCTFNRSCALTGKASDVQLDHFIPIFWGTIVTKYGIGGTTNANTIPFHRSINASKGAMNPFIWYERYGARHGISEDKWKGIVDYIAEKHRMTTAEYINRVNACYSEYLAIRWISDIDHLLESRDEVHMAFIDRALRLGLAIHVVIELFGSLKIKEYFVNNQTIELVAERKGVFAARLRTQ